MSVMTAARCGEDEELFGRRGANRRWALWQHTGGRIVAAEGSDERSGHHQHAGRNHEPFTKAERRQDDRSDVSGNDPGEGVGVAKCDDHGRAETVVGEALEGTNSRGWLSPEENGTAPQARHGPSPLSLQKPSLFHDAGSAALRRQRPAARTEQEECRSSRLRKNELRRRSSPAPKDAQAVGQGCGVLLRMSIIRVKGESTHVGHFADNAINARKLRRATRA